MWSALCTHFRHCTDTFTHSLVVDHHLAMCYCLISRPFVPYPVWRGNWWARTVLKKDLNICKFECKTLGLSKLDCSVFVSSNLIQAIYYFLLDDWIRCSYFSYILSVVSWFDDYSKEMHILRLIRIIGKPTSKM